MNKPNDSYSGFILTFEPERTKWIAEHIEIHDITESFSSRDNKFEPKELVFLVLDHEPPSFSAIAIMQRVRGSGGSAKIKMRFSNSIIFNKDIILLEELGCSNSDLRSPESIQRVSQSKWLLMVENIKKTCPDQASEIQALIESRTQVNTVNFDTPKGQNINEQRDGLGLALEISDIGKREVLSGIRLDYYDNAKSVLDIFDSIEPYERDLVERDAVLFRKILGIDPASVGKFTDGIDRSVRVMVTDKTSIEETLGVDLIIYSSCYNSYLLLQYKRMEKIKSSWLYRISPSSNIHDQLQIMDGFHRVAGTSSPTKKWDYRLNSNPFYFKFCERKIDLSKEDSLIRGITMNEEQFRCHFSSLATTESPKSGTIGYDNCSRYLSNTDFIQLAKGGWIGANDKSSEIIAQILKQNMQRNRSAMLAIIDFPQNDSAFARRRRKA